ncbi:MAG: signal peptidase II [Candidatus Aminicenantes bacterium]|nr:MAG: signal peptidase II [Candidatus Aminicenantes bacterium]
MIRKGQYFLVVVVLMGLDQLTKALIVRSITLQGSREVIPGFFNLTHVRNRGAIFGFFSHSDSRILYIFLTLVSVAALGLVIYYFFKTPVSERLMKISLSLILAGALGNLIDRLFRGHVIDFLDFYVKDWHWPSFNVADSCITVGASLLIFILIFKRVPIDI